MDLKKCPQKSGNHKMHVKTSGLREGTNTLCVRFVYAAIIRIANNWSMQSCLRTVC